MPRQKPSQKSSKAKSAKTDQVVETLDEFLERVDQDIRLHGCVVDAVVLGPTPARGNAFEIMSYHYVPITGDIPSVCPNASPKLPEKLLPAVVASFRERGLIRADESIHWVGDQSRIESLCTCDLERRGADVEGEKPGDLVRPCYARDHLWLKWYKAKGQPTHRSYAKIRDRWNAFPEDERKKIAPHNYQVLPARGRRAGTDVVKAALAKAKRERDAKSPKS